MDLSLSPAGPQMYVSYDHFPSSGTHSWNRPTQSWQNLHIGSLTWGVRNVMVRKTHVDGIELPLPTKWKTSGGCNTDTGLKGPRGCVGTPAGRKNIEVRNDCG